MCRFSHIFWIDASSEDTIALDLKHLCSHPEAKAAGISVSSQSALIWIASLQSEWLLVFDNADGAPEVLENFIPSSSKGNILVTSRNPSLGQVTSYENCLEIDQMAEEDAILLLLKASHLTEQSENVYIIAQQIVNELCCLPLAVDQAGASIEAGLCSIDNYLVHLSQDRNKLMNNPSFRGASQYNRTVYETWDLSFNEIESRAKKKSNGHDRVAAQAAILILETAAFLHHENIIEAAFKKAAISFYKGHHSRLEQKVETCITQLLQLGEDQLWNPLFFHDGVRVLISFSLIKQCSASSGIYAIHPLVHKWSRDRMSMSHKKCMMQVANLIIVNCITEEMTAENIVFNRLLVPHIKANYRSQKENGFKRMFDDDEYSRFSYVLSENGMWKDVEYLQYQIVQMEIKKWGTEHPLTLTSMANLAVTYSKQGKYEEAEELQLKVLDLHEKVLGPEHPSTLTSIANLARIYSDQEKYEEAVELQLKFLDSQEKVWGPGHLYTITIMNNLAATYSKQGKYDEAAKLQLNFLDLQKKVLGPGHSYTITSMNNLAESYLKQGKYDEAVELQLKFLDLQKKLLGPEHSYTITTMNNLAATYSKQGKFDEAAKLQPLHYQLPHPSSMSSEPQAFPCAQSVFSVHTTQDTSKNVKFTSSLKLHIQDEVKLPTDESVIGKHFIIGAESALKGIQDKEIAIEAAFNDFNISSLEYAVLAGFNEALIQSGTGYLPEIHIFCSTDITQSAESFVTKLGKILAPLPGALFTPSSTYQIPVFKDNEAHLSWDELIFSHTEQYADICSAIAPTLIQVVSCPQGSLSDGEMSSRDHEGNNNNPGHENPGDLTDANPHHENPGDLTDSNLHHENPGDLTDANPHHENPGDLTESNLHHENPGDLTDANPHHEHPGDPSNGSLTSELPFIYFDAQAKIKDNTASPKLLQKLQVNGRLIIQVSCILFSLPED